MKYFKRVMLIIFVIICLAVVVNGIYLSQMSKTVDCSGVVDSVSVQNKTIKITDSNNTEYLLKVKFYTSLKDINNDKISIDKIEVGDIITANYCGKWESSNSELAATYIKVAK